MWMPVYLALDRYHLRMRPHCHVVLWITEAQGTVYKQHKEENNADIELSFETM